MITDPSLTSSTSAPTIPLSSQQQQQEFHRQQEQQQPATRSLPLPGQFCQGEPTATTTTTTASHPQQLSNPSITTTSKRSSPMAGTSVTHITQCLEDRLFQWKIFLKNLIKYFELRSDSAHRTSQLDSKSLKQLDINAFSTASAGFPQESDLRKALIHLEEFTQMELADSESLGKYIQVNVVGVLIHWLTEIKSMARNIRSDIGYGDKHFNQEQSLFENAFREMNEGAEMRKQALSALLIHSSKRRQEGVEDVSILESLDRMKHPATDPWLVYQDLSHRQGANAELNRNIQISAKKKQDMYAAFELNLMNNLKKVLADYTLFEAELVDRLRMKRNSLGQQIEIMDPQKEINLFYSMHPGLFVRSPVGGQAAVPVTVPTGGIGAEAIPAAAGASPLDSQLDTSLLKVDYSGILAFKRSGILVKGFREYQGILTKTGYLHLYSPNTDLESISSGLENASLQESSRGRETGTKTRAVPEISILLSDYELRPHPLMGRDPEDIELVNTTKTLFKGKGPNVIELKAMNFEDAKNWWHLLVPYVRQAYQVETVGPSTTTGVIPQVKPTTTTAPQMGMEREERAL